MQTVSATAGGQGTDGAVQTDCFGAETAQLRLRDDRDTGRSELYHDSQFRLELVDWVRVDNRYAGLERNNQIIGHIPSNGRIEGKEQPARLARNRIAEIDANIVAGIEGHKPAIGKTDIQSWCDLRLADVPSSRITSHADGVPNDRHEICVRSEVEEGIPHPEARHHLPFPASDHILAGSHKARAKAECPITVDGADQSSLGCCATEARFDTDVRRAEGVELSSPLAVPAPGNRASSRRRAQAWNCTSTAQSTVQSGCWSQKMSCIADETQGFAAGG